MTGIRVVVLDGLDWLWCSEHRDLCPELWALAEEGCSAPLRACDAPITPTGVAALLAGRDVDLDWTDDHYTSSADLIRTRPWVHELARNGLTLGLVNVPLTWPAFPLPKGSYVVSGFPVDAVALRDRTRPWHRPTGLDVLGYPIDMVVCDHGPGGTRDVQGLARAEGEITDWLLRSERKDVEIVWFRSTDSAGHHLWGTEGYAQAVSAASKLLPRLREGCENLIVISDHGFDALSSPRVSAYRATKHGPAAARAGLAGGHSSEGVLVASGDSIRARGLLPEQRLLEVAGGLFDLLQLPPAPGMISAGPAWASSIPVGSDEGDRVREQLRRLGYLGD